MRNSLLTWRSYWINSGMPTGWCKWRYNVNKQYTWYCHLHWEIGMPISCLCDGQFRSPTLFFVYVYQWYVCYDWLLFCPRGICMTNCVPVNDILGLPPGEYLSYYDWSKNRLYRTSHISVRILRLSASLVIFDCMDFSYIQQGAHISCKSYGGYDLCLCFQHINVLSGMWKMSLITTIKHACMLPGEHDWIFDSCISFQQL